MSTVEHRTRVYTVPGISCDHCKNAIESHLGPVDGVEAIAVDVESKTVTVTGAADDDAIIAAIDDAGYEVA